MSGKTKLRAPMVILALLLIAGLVSGCPAPTPTLTHTPLPPTDTPTPSPTSIPEPTFTPTPTPPPPPVTDPEGETEVKAGKQQTVRASAAGAEGYQWELLGSGSLSTTGPGDTTIYTAPEEVPEGGEMAQLNVTAYNSWGESPPTSLIISILDPDTKSVALSELDVIPVGWMSTGGSTIDLVSSSIPCKETEADCFEITYEEGDKESHGGIYWWPLGCGDSGTEESWDLAESGACGIDVHKVGGFSEVTRLTFWVRGARGGEKITFKVGGQKINPKPVRSLGTVKLSTGWEKKQIDLRGVDLSNAVGLFCWYATSADNPERAVFYLNDIRLEGVR